MCPIKYFALNLFEYNIILLSILSEEISTLKVILYSLLLIDMIIPLVFHHTLNIVWQITKNENDNNNSYRKCMNGVIIRNREKLR